MNNKNIIVITLGGKKKEEKVNPLMYSDATIEKIFNFVKGSMFKDMEPRELEAINEFFEGEEIEFMLHHLTATIVTELNKINLPEHRVFPAALGFIKNKVDAEGEKFTKELINRVNKQTQESLEILSSVFATDQSFANTLYSNFFKNK